MHFRNSRCDFPIDDVSPFLKIMERIKNTECDELEIMSDKLPASMEIVVLKPS